MAKTVIFTVFLFVFNLVESKKINITDFLLSEIPVPSISLFYVELSPPDYQELQMERISAYNPVPRQTWGDPNVSSCGPNQYRQIAVSRDLFFNDSGEKHLCGKRVSVLTDRGEEFHDYVIWDTMAPRFTNTVDIMIPNDNEAEAYEFGITTGVLIIYD
jgi:hypothetical protein